MRFVDLSVSVTVKEPSCSVAKCLASDLKHASARKPRDHGGGDRLCDPVAAASASVCVENEKDTFSFVVISKASFSFS